MDNILQHFCFKLSQYAVSISTSKSNGVDKYSLLTNKSYIEIQYYFIDGFYRIRVENRSSEGVYNVFFLTKSKAFHREVKDRIKKSKLSNKKFEDHMTCFVEVMERFFEKDEKMEYFDRFSMADLRFDGLFI